MNILVTGATGFVGVRLIKQASLLYPDWNIFVLHREHSDKTQLIESCSRLHFLMGDITDPASIRKAVQESKPDIIYHLANAGVYAGKSVVAEESFRVNTLGTLSLLEAAREFPYTHFINVGSSSEYGIKYAPMCEVDICEPQSAYGISKLSATVLARLEHQLYGRSIATFRLFSPYGPHDNPQRLIAKTINSCLSRKPFSLPSAWVCRDYIFVDDVVDLLLIAGTRKDTYKGDIFNVGSGTQSHSIDVVHLIAQLTNSKDWVHSLTDNLEPLGISESPLWVADMRKTFSNFSWQPRVTLEAGLITTIAYAQNTPHRQFP